MPEAKDEIKQKIDLVELIGEYLILKPSGTHSFKAVCPFHSEKTPSFHVSSDRQIWHCFGCGEGGDCFSFVMKMDGMDFQEALLHLGQKVGVEIKRLSTPLSNTRQRLLDIHVLAEKFYRKILTDSPLAEEARTYVNSRGITPELCEKFGIGFSTDDWDSCTQFLFKRGYSEFEIIASGLAQKKKNGSGAIDRFRGRIMIPLRDQHGKTVGFTARIFPNSTTPLLRESTPPKYLNSPETLIYHKGSLLYGLDLAKRTIKLAGYVVIVEGNLDVIASHKDGVEHVVACSGTALTEDQLRLLGRYIKSLVFCLDQDAAGFTAVKRATTLARVHTFDVRAIVLPKDVKDPDELVQKSHGMWREISAQSIPMMQYLIDRVTTGKNLTHVDNKKEIATELLPALSEIKEIVEQEHWLQVIASLLSIDATLLRQKIKSSQNLNTKIIQEIDAPTSAIKHDQHAELLLGLFINDPTAHSSLIESLKEYIPVETQLEELYREIFFLYHDGHHAPEQSFFQRLVEHTRQSREDLTSLLMKLSLLAEQTFSQLSPSEVQKQIQRLSSVLRQRTIRERRRLIAQQMRQAELAGDQEAVISLLLQLKDLT